jgi:hypothetical protein
MGPAGDFVKQFRLDHPVEASCYKTLKRALKDRFMGKILNTNTKGLMTTAKEKQGNPSELLHVGYKNY